MASVLWALDFFAMRDPSTESQARIIRSGLVEDLRAKRPFQDAIDPAIDHGGGDTRPWAKIEGWRLPIRRKA